MRILLFVAIFSAMGCTDLTRPTGGTPSSSPAPGGAASNAVPAANPTPIAPGGGH